MASCTAETPVQPSAPEISREEVLARRGDPSVVQAVGLLRSLGYARVRLYAGGMTDWTKHRGPVEAGSAAGPVPPGPRRADGRSVDLVLSELQTIAAMAAEAGARPERILPRIESAATVFAGELQAIHDLLYRLQQAPDEQVLEAILANLCAGLWELSDVLRRLTDVPQRSATLKTNLRTMSRLANEICGHCVPRAYTQALTGWMDRIQDLARTLA